MNPSRPVLDARGPMMMQAALLAMPGHDGTRGPGGPPGPDPSRGYRSLAAHLGTAGVGFTGLAAVQAAAGWSFLASLFLGIWLLATGAWIHRQGIRRRAQYREMQYRQVGEQRRHQVLLRLVRNHLAQRQATSDALAD